MKPSDLRSHAPERASTPDFRALYEAHAPFAWRCLRRFGVRDSDLSDVVQKVFLTAFLRLPEFEQRSSFKSWLFGICQRQASDYRRSAPIRREVAVDGTDFDRAPAPGDPSANTETRQEAMLAENILRKIPEAQREVFVLFEIEEFSGEEIAELLGISVGTVRSRLRLARESFRREVARLSANESREAV
ncbi:MAG: sigma-70 family RNA polymerase sigma factor [Myxococcales bacterium]